MPDSPAGAQTDVLLRLSVPPDGALREVAREVAARVAEYCGASVPDAEALATSLERAVAGITGAGPAGPVDLVFRRAGGDLVIEARTNGRSSEVRHALPA